MQGLRIPDRRTLTQRYLYFLLRHRFAVCTLILLGTLVFGYNASRLRIYTDFFDLYPPAHPYIKLYNEHRHLMGTANILQVVLEVEHGTIYTTKTLKKLDSLTRALMDSRGVNPFQVISLTHPSVRDITISAAGITALPIVRKVPESEHELQKIREKVYMNVGVRGVHVSFDDKAALITAGLWEERTDFVYLWQRANELVTTYQDDNTQLYVTGHPMLYAWVQHYYSTLLLVIVLTAVIIAVLLGLYFRTLIGVLVPLFSGLLSALWALGFAGLCGFHLDPLILVVFVFITARALSHSVQSMERFHEEYYRLGDKQAAIISSYVKLFDPAFVSVAADALALLTLAVARIPVIQNLAFVASFWILTIAVSVLTLHPVLLSLFPPPYRDNKAGARLSDRFYTLMCRFLVWFSRDNRRYVSVVVFIFALTLGISFSLQLQVGTVSIGEALMYPQHPYTIAARKVAEKFIGTNQMIIVAEGRVDLALKTESVLTAIEAFQWHMQQHNAAGSASATSTIKRVFRLLHEGDPNWEILPTRQHDIDTSFFLMSGSPELVRLLVDRYRNTPITLYYQYASNAEAKQALSTAKEFLAAHPQETVMFRLAGGLIGILAAMQEEVERSHRYNLLLILLAVFICGYLIYRSALGALIVMLPSLIAQPLTEAVMYVASIDMNVGSLPVAAVGIGIGIDYGYYVLSRIIEEYAVCQDFDEANRRALLTTGKAVFFTGTTLVAGVILWVFFPMKFHAEMAILLSAILIFHMVGALVFIPAAISLLHPRFASDLAQHMTAQSAR